MSENTPTKEPFKIFYGADAFSEEAQKFLISLQYPPNVELIRVEEEDTCPSCGGVELFVEGRCTTCLDCGWSKCSL